MKKAPRRSNVRYSQRIENVVIEERYFLKAAASCHTALKYPEFCHCCGFYIFDTFPQKVV